MSLCLPPWVETCLADRFSSFPDSFLMVSPSLLCLMLLGLKLVSRFLWDPHPVCVVSFFALTCRIDIQTWREPTHYRGWDYPPLQTSVICNNSLYLQDHISLCIYWDTFLNCFCSHKKNHEYEFLWGCSSLEAAPFLLFGQYTNTYLIIPTLKDPDNQKYIFLMDQTKMKASIFLKNVQNRKALQRVAEAVRRTVGCRWPADHHRDLWNQIQETSLAHPNRSHSHPLFSPLPSGRRLQDHQTEEQFFPEAVRLLNSGRSL